MAKFTPTIEVIHRNAQNIVLQATLVNYSQISVYTTICTLLTPYSIFALYTLQQCLGNTDDTQYVQAIRQIIVGTKVSFILKQIYELFCPERAGEM